jgi:hypothetical protein
MGVRRTCQDLISDYRSARRGRDPDKLQRTSIELGAALEKRGHLIEMGPRPGYATIWQSIPCEGGPAGFAPKAFRLTSAVMAPAYRWPKMPAPTAGPKARTRYLQLQPT